MLSFAVLLLLLLQAQLAEEDSVDSHAATPQTALNVVVAV
jgi:hypothetical protein